jgi:ribose/xylose/arabinose/galactoside ABC-type transport system permease subunit
MDAFAQYISLWNSWVVFPVLLVAAAAAHWRFRKHSTLLLTVGLALMLIGQGMRVLYPAPLHPAYVTSFVFDASGLLAAIGGFMWFMWRDYRAPPRAI